jgi:hypothetical protein
VAAENYYQHAEHYFRMINANQEQFPPRPPQQGYQGGPQAGQQGGYAPSGDVQPVPGLETPGTGPQPAAVVVHTQPHMPNVSGAAPQGAIQQGGPLPSFLATPGGEQS